MASLYFSNRNIRLFLILALVLAFLLLTFYAPKIKVDGFVENTADRPFIFTTKKLQSWPILRPVSRKLVRSSPIVLELYRESRNVDLNLILPVFLTESYLPVFFNWVSQVLLQDSAHLLKHLLVITMDNRSYAAIEHFNLPLLYLNPPEFLKQLGYLEIIKNPLHQIFSVRLICFWLLSGWGFDIIHFDVDAIPVRPKFLDLFVREGGADLVAGVGTFPMSARKALGATVCMGSFFLRSLTKSEGVFKLFGEMRNVDSGDDQVVFNVALAQMGISWESREEGQVWVGIDSSNLLSVNFLPQTWVCRNKCPDMNMLRGTPEDQLYVMHPKGPKTGLSKVAVLKTVGLWNENLTADFSNISKYNNDLVEFVKKIS